ncbi:NAD-dependent epimerase/dehydratase family protein [Algiphilus sp.]|uniref:NAD-dependent epimerase/dehydratase family protein n=1 Tax=Algiphilus sp. TaxID=1872431 RepID=UPI003C3B6386
MKTAITGGCGYVGLNLVRTLLDAGHEVLALDRVQSPHLDSRAQWQEQDIFDAPSLQTALEGVDVVFHLVAKISLAQEDAATWHVNVEGAKVVAEAALMAGVRRMVHVSSIASFDMYQSRGRTMNESMPRSVDPGLHVYARSKYAGECEVMKVAARGLEVVVCYPTGVFGPQDFGSPMPHLNGNMVDSARGRLPVMVEGGFDLVDVRDVAQGLLLAAEHGRNGENYLLGGEFVSMIDACRRAAQLVGERGPRFMLPMKVLKGIAAVVGPLARLFGREAGSFSEVALATIETSGPIDHSKAARELGYQPRPTDETLRDLLDFCIERGILQAGDKGRLDDGAGRRA